MSPESSEQPRQYNELAARKFIRMLNDEVQDEIHATPGEESSVVERVVEAYRTSPSDEEKHANTKADSALDMLSNPLPTSPRKRLQIVRGYAHREIEAQLRSTDNPRPDMSSPEIQDQIDDFVIALSPHMILGQIARRYSQLHAEIATDLVEQYPPISLEVAENDVNNIIVGLMDTEQIARRNAVGLMLMFGLQVYSKDDVIKAKQKLEVVTAKSILNGKLASSPLTPTYDRLRKLAEFEARSEKSVAEKLESIYADYLKTEQMGADEARRRFLLDSRRILPELFSHDQ